MSYKYDGGPAFPSHGSMGEVAHQGMTLRDYFATSAMKAMVTDHGDTCDGYREAVASRAYKMADAMIKERAK